MVKEKRERIIAIILTIIILTIIFTPVSIGVWLSSLAIGWKGFWLSVILMTYFSCMPFFVDLVDNLLF